MYIGNDICQLLQSCMEEPASVDHVRNPQFPLSEFFYMVLSTGVELRDNFSFLEYLPQLIEQYRNDHPDCTLTVEELVSEGWLTPFMDRWDFNIVPDKADIMSDALTPNDKERVAVLCWLLDQRKELEGVFVLQFRKILRQFQQNFPTIPDQDWFVRNGYLSKNGQCLSHGHYSSEIAEALAFLWARNVNPDDTEQLDWWLNLAVALGLLRSAFEKLSSDHQKLLLERILLRLEAGTYPDLRAENIRIAMFLGWRQKQYATNNEFITGDLVVDIHSFNRAYWEWGHRLYQRQKVLAFYLSTLCSYVSVLEKPLFTRAARIIRRLATLGCLYGIHIPASALLCLWESPETSLIACERMMFQYMQKSVLPDDLFCTILQKIVEQDVLDRCQSTGDGTEPLSLLRFFAHQPQGGRLGDCAVKALAQLLTALKRGRQRLEYLLDSLVGALALRLEQEREYLSWAYDFRLACLVMQKVYYHGDMLVAGSAHSFQALRGMLLTQYIRIFQPDGVLKEFVPSFLDDVCFFQSFWCDVYREEMSSMLERCQFLQPQLTPPKGEKSQLIHYHKCVIHLTVLTVLMQNRQDPDTILEDAFAQTLVQILRPQNNLLNYDRIAMMEAQPIFEAAIALVRSSEKCYNLFMQELESYELPELILICHGAKDSKLRMRCCHIIENSINGKNDALRVFSIEKLVQIILDERVESLYTMVEHVLEHQLEKWKNRKSYMSRQQQDWAESELNRVWLLKKAYEKVLKEGLPFYQAIVWMESPKHQDLDRAEKIWEYLLEKSLYSSYVINLIHTYILQYKAAQSKEDGIVVCSKIMERALVLRERVENSAYSAWSEADQNAYVRMLYTLYRETGMGREKVIQLLSLELNFGSEVFEQSEEEEKGATDQVTIKSKNPVPALQQFCSAPLRLKSEWFFQLKSCSCPEVPQTALLLWCIMNTLDHLSAYGPQLLLNQKLGEDRCSQLFREFFNHGYPEMYGLSANDQEKTGHTGHISRDGSCGIGEVDIMIKHNGHRVGIVEALALKSMDRTDIYEHIHQLLGYNIQYVPMFLFVYGNVKDPKKLWQSYSEYIKNSFVSGFEDENWGVCKVQDFVCSDDYISELHDTFYFNRHMLRMTFENAGNEVPMYHIFLNIGGLEILPSAVEARKNH